MTHTRINVCWFGMRLAVTLAIISLSACSAQRATADSLVGSLKIVSEGALEGQHVVMQPARPDAETYVIQKTETGFVMPYIRGESNLGTRFGRQAESMNAQLSEMSEEELARLLDTTVDGAGTAGLWGFRQGSVIGGTILAFVVITHGTERWPTGTYVFVGNTWRDVSEISPDIFSQVQKLERY